MYFVWLIYLYYERFLKSYFAQIPVVPSSLFARDGTMLHCSCKSALMHILEKAGGPSTNTQEITAGFKVAIVDGMAEVQ